LIPSSVLRCWAFSSRELGRAPTDDDLKIPSSTGKHAIRTTAFAAFTKIWNSSGSAHVASTIFGARAQGRARVVTYGPRGNIMDLCTTLPWELLCEEVGTAAGGANAVVAGLGLADDRE